MKKNVLIIVDKLKSGGAEKIATNLAVYLNKIYGYNVKIATFQNKNKIREKNRLKKIFFFFKKVANMEKKFYFRSR